MFKVDINCLVIILIIIRLSAPIISLRYCYPLLWIHLLQLLFIPTRSVGLSLSLVVKWLRWDLIASSMRWLYCFPLGCRLCSRSASSANRRHYWSRLFPHRLLLCSELLHAVLGVDICDLFGRHRWESWERSSETVEEADWATEWCWSKGESKHSV